MHQIDVRHVSVRAVCALRARAAVTPPRHKVAELGVVAGTTTITNEAIVDWLKYYVEHSPQYSFIYNNCQHFVQVIISVSASAPLHLCSQ